jgi:protein tyrosine/serine phosphatase
MAAVSMADANKSRAKSQWAESDALAAALAALNIQDSSKTIEFDASHPPTPDESGKPVNFQVIAPGLYRSSYPQYAHFNTLADLELKTIVTLVPETLPFEYANFINSNGIVHHHIPILANKDEEKFTDAETVNKVLAVMLEPSNYPLMIHCNKGKHRTGCMTACFRKVTGWTLEACIAEYECYSAPKSRALDKVFIDKYDPSVLKHIALERGYVGGVYRQPVNESTKSSVYTSNTLETTTTNDSEQPSNDNQERVFKQNEAALESCRLWSHR